MHQTPDVAVWRKGSHQITDQCSPNPPKRGYTTTPECHHSAYHCDLWLMAFPTLVVTIEQPVRMCESMQSTAYEQCKLN